MADDSTPDKQSPFWPFNWLRDEKFWRDITVQVVGTGLVALVVVVYASAAGYLSPTEPNAGFRVLMFGIGIALVVMALVMAWLTVSSAKEMRRREGKPAYWRYLIGIGALQLFIFALVAVPWLISILNDAPALSNP